MEDHGFEYFTLFIITAMILFVVIGAWKIENHIVGECLHNVEIALGRCSPDCGNDVSYAWWSKICGEIKDRLDK